MHYSHPVEHQSPMTTLSTCRFDFRKESTDFLPFYDICDNMARDFWMCTVGNDYRRPTLQCPKRRFHLRQTILKTILYISSDINKQV